MCHCCPNYDRNYPCFRKIVLLKGNMYNFLMEEMEETMSQHTHSYVASYGGSVNTNKIPLIQAIESLGCCFPISDCLILLSLWVVYCIYKQKLQDQKKFTSRSKQKWHEGFKTGVAYGIQSRGGMWGS